MKNTQQDARTKGGSLSDTTEQRKKDDIRNRDQQDDEPRDDTESEPQ